MMKRLSPHEAGLSLVGRRIEKAEVMQVGEDFYALRCYLDNGIEAFLFTGTRFLNIPNTAEACVME